MKVVVYKKISQSMKDTLEQNFNVCYFDGITDSNRAEFEKEIADADGLLGTSCRITSQYLDLAPKLKAISTVSVGVDLFDSDDLTKRNIALMHTPNVLTDTTADLIFSLMMASGRRLVELDNYVKDGKWQDSIAEDCFGYNIHGKKLGIIGMGRIGYAVAKRAHLGFDMDILYYNRSENKQAQTLNAQKCELNVLLKESDFVCVVVPLSKETTKLIGQPEFDLMKPTAYLINGARGPVLDEQALINAIKDKKIAGAGLDVFVQEPISMDSELLKLPQVIAVPHVGSATHETRKAMGKCAVENLIQALKGNLSKNCYNFN